MKNGPLRILMTLDAVGGVWAYARELMKALPQTQYTFLAVGFGPAPYNTQLEEMRSMAHVQWVHRPYALEWMEAPWAEVDTAGRWLLDLAEDFSPDVVHLNGYSHAALSWKAPVLVVAHSCVLSCWRAVKEETTKAVKKESVKALKEETAKAVKKETANLQIYSQRVQTGLEAAQKAIAPSEDMKNSLRREYHFSGSVEVIPKGSSSKVECRKEKYILAAGRIGDEAKNIALLDRLASKFHWPIWIAGETRKSSFQPTSSLFLGTLDTLEMLRTLARASIFAAPALYEPFGLTVLEAAAHSCALILSDIPSFRENWEDAAIFISPRDPGAWPLVINHLIANPAQLSHLQKQASRRAKCFTVSRMACAYRKIYQELAQSKMDSGTCIMPPISEGMPISR